MENNEQSVILRLEAILLELEREFQTLVSEKVVPNSEDETNKPSSCSQKCFPR